MKVILCARGGRTMKDLQSYLDEALKHVKFDSVDEEPCEVYDIPKKWMILCNCTKSAQKIDFQLNNSCNENQ